ncbi:MAG: alpha/beta hydrolase-fold protein [Eubacteriales bacterium]
MAYIEFNALSVYLGGSFSAKVFLPEMDKLELDDSGHKKSYPVLWLLHTNGGNALDWLRTPAEQCAIDNGIFIIAPDVGHTLCTNMEYGAPYERFMYEEFPAICKNTFPISGNLELNWIGGVGTGAYGAAKMAIKHPDVFSKCLIFDGYLDMKKICDRAIIGEQTGIHHTKASLEAVFGELEEFMGSENDIFTEVSSAKAGEFYMSCSKDSKNLEEYKVFAELLGEKTIFDEGDYKADDLVLEEALPRAVGWACKKAKWAEKE